MLPGLMSDLMDHPFFVATQAQTLKVILGDRHVTSRFQLAVTTGRSHPGPRLSGLATLITSV